MEWIKTIERLPDADMIVLVFNREWNDQVWLGCFDDDEESWCGLDSLPFELPPTHWAEIPATPNR